MPDQSPSLPAALWVVELMLRANPEYLIACVVVNVLGLLAAVGLVVRWPHQALPGDRTEPRVGRCGRHRYPSACTGRVGADPETTVPLTEDARRVMR